MKKDLLILAINVDKNKGFVKQDKERIF